MICFSPCNFLFWVWAPSNGKSKQAWQSHVSMCHSYIVEVIVSRPYSCSFLWISWFNNWYSTILPRGLIGYFFKNQPEVWGITTPIWPLCKCSLYMSCIYSVESMQNIRLNGFVICLEILALEIGTEKVDFVSVLERHILKKYIYFFCVLS